MFLYRTGLLLITTVVVLMGAVLLTHTEDLLTEMLCRFSGAETPVAGAPGCGLNTDLQVMAIVIALVLLGILMTGLGLLIRRRETTRRRMFRPRG